MEKQMWRFGLALALVNLLGATALAEEGCSIFPDMFDEYSLGRIPIGANARDYSSNKNLKECMETPAKKYPTKCYFEEDGIAYTALFNIDQPEMAEVVGALTTEDSDTLSEFSLIAGLEWGDPLDVVNRKLNALPRHLPKWYLHIPDNEWGFWLETGPCWRSSKGAVWEYYLHFDGGDDLWLVSMTIKNYNWLTSSGRQLPENRIAALR
jgi:hypothetical protein